MEERGFAGKIARDFKRFRVFYGRLLDVTLDSRPAVYTVWIVVSLLAIPMYTMSPKELAPTEDEGVIFGIIDASADSTVDQTSRFTAAVNQAYLSVPETQFTFQITRPNSGFAGMVVQPWVSANAISSRSCRGSAEGARHPRHSDAAGAAAGAAGRGPVSGGVHPGINGGLGTAVAVCRQIQLKAMQSGMFAFPPVIDVKIDQPQSEIVIDRDKTAELGLDLQQVGSDMAAMVGGNFVNRFDIAGRSYKVIPQIQRVDRLNPDQLKNVYVTGPGGQLVPLSTIATLRNSTVPRSLNRFQQLNAVKISGVSVRPLDEALRFLEDEAAKILPKGYVIDYTGESRQLRSEGNRFLYTFALAVILIFLVLAAQFNSFRDPFVILAGSVPLAMFGRWSSPF